MYAFQVACKSQSRARLACSELSSLLRSDRPDRRTLPQIRVSPTAVYCRQNQPFQLVIHERRECRSPHPPVWYFPLRRGGKLWERALKAGTANRGRIADVANQEAGWLLRAGRSHCDCIRCGWHECRRWAQSGPPAHLPPERSTEIVDNLEAKEKGRPRAAQLNLRRRRNWKTISDRG